MQNLDSRNIKHQKMKIQKIFFFNSVLREKHQTRLKPVFSDMFVNETFSFV